MYVVTWFVYFVGFIDLSEVVWLYLRLKGALNTVVPWERSPVFLSL